MDANSADVIIIGLGAMGTAAAYQCARAGMRVIGLEQYLIGHERGSSHGKSRVIRKAYFEDPRYVPLLHDAYDAWREIEGASGQKLLNLVGCLNLGTPDHQAIAGAQASVREHVLEHQVLSAEQIRARWPFFQPLDEDIGIYESDGGYISPETAIECLTSLAKKHGANLIESELVRGWSSSSGTVIVETQKARYSAGSLIIAAGAWLPNIVTYLNAPLKVERQVQAWFKPRQPELFSGLVMPVFIHFCGEKSYYGIPPNDPAVGIKIARHHGGAITTADNVNREISREDEEDIRGYIRRHLPAADGPLLDAKICLYTNTPDSHFIIDRHPECAHVYIAGGFSGHGFKFAPVVGKALAEMALQDEVPEGLEMFRISRFGNPLS